MSCPQTCGEIIVVIFKVILVIICLPVLLVVSLVGIILGILCCPFKICCPCCAPCIEGILDVVLFLIGLPFKCIIWATVGGEEEGGKGVKTPLDQGTTPATTYDGSASQQQTALSADTSK
ncbi:uncharacterized protein LOC115929489 [Strongylocentrotus purpuratus]|uniref:Uncharacterized protein n=1 Tax=Strongylocentrotus purpuratus TaxID=7668 RepID=A0A7M7PP49_STRPU|nr:uncharacterized protein LOC115929489 [Strongylocentrotus purpuratus]|eukprot:XP_001196883.1 PREDICTED: uncharacterized protein LOC756896 [Strongylocentrotus purpuratus]